MFGFVIGTLSLIGLAKVLSHHHWHRRYAYGGGCGGWRGGCGGYESEGYEDGERYRGRSGGRRRGYGLRWLFERLDTTPGQEKVIQEAIDEFKETVRKNRDEWKGSFETLADAIRGLEFDHGGVAETWVKHDKAIEAIRLALVAQLDKVHAALDERQRKILSDLIARGGGFARFGGPFSRGFDA
jgi:hypothetical protein